MIDRDTAQQEESVTRVSRTPDQIEEATITTRATVPSRGAQIGNLIWLVAGIVDAALLLDFIFKLVGAAGVGFVGGVGDFSAALNSPFRGVMATTVTPGAHLAYWPDIVAIVVYALAAWILVSLIRIAVAPRSRNSRAV